MYRRILVALDGSEPAEAALSYAEALGRESDGTLYLVQAARPDAEAAAGRYLDRLAADLRARGLAAETIVLGRLPAEAVATAAERCQADLIAMATHGRTGIQRTMQGSVADEVLHRTPVPLLLVRLGHVAPPGWPRRVLVPLDGSDLAEGALDHVFGLIDRDAEIVLYQAVLPEATAMVDQLYREPVWAGLLSDAETEARTYLDGVAARQGASSHHVRTIAEFGEPAAGITDLCRCQQIDLVALSSHGRTGLPRRLLGSVTDDLLRTAPAPLLVVRPLLDAAHARPPRELSHLTPRVSSPPPAPLPFTAREVELLRLALARLVRDPAGAEPLTAEIQSLEQRLCTRTIATTDGSAPASAISPTPVSPVGDRQCTSDGAERTVDCRAIQPGYPVFACHVDATSDFDLGQFVGVVDEVIDSSGAPYLHVRGGLEQAHELFLPLGAVRAAAGHQVRLNLTPADLVGQTWHVPPPTMLRAV